MRYLYTTTPDENCHEVTKGIYGRPVHTSQQKALLAQGWKFRVSDLEKSYVRQEKEGREEGEEVSENMDYDEYLLREYERVFGKKPHHKLKRESIQKKLEEADEQD